MGFDDCRFMFNDGHGKRIIFRPDGRPEMIFGEVGDEESYTTAWLTSRTIDFICATRETPFCHMLSIPDPHQPYRAR